MLVKCCYRLIPDGEIIHAHYDTEQQTIDNMPLDWFDPKLLELSEYSKMSYKDTDYDYAAMCESLLLSNNEFALVVENNNIGYYILEWGGIKRFMQAPTDTTDSSSGCAIPMQSNYCAIGFRTTQLTQLRACSGVYRIVMSKRTKFIHTNRGILRPDFDISQLSPIDFHYAGYKDAVRAGHDGVVYLNGVPTFVRITDDDRLVIL